MFFSKKYELCRAQSIGPALTTIPAEHAEAEFREDRENAAIGTSFADLKWLEQMCSARQINHGCNAGTHLDEKTDR